MADQEKKPAGAKNKKKKFYGQHAKGMLLGRTIYKSKVAQLENDTFNVGAASNPAKFRKLLKKLATTFRRHTRAHTTWSRCYSK
jgi:hypothetical protein